MNQTVPIISEVLSKKLEMEVQIVSKEIIKPSVSTPHHLKTYKFSILDQLATPVYVPIILFYSPTNENSSKKSDHLKKSFSKTLTHFYPFAGRIKDHSSIDCSDDGATYVEAKVAGDMSMVIKQADIYQLQQLLPCHPHEQSLELSNQIILAVQVNHFDCGGMAISTCVWHGVADASSLGTFVKSWAAIACGENDIDGVILDCTPLFPPHDVPGFSMPNFVKQDLICKIVSKRFLFDGSKIAALRKEIGGGPSFYYPTRFEAVSALIWGAVMAATGEENEAMKIDNVTVAVDLRRRMDPTLPSQAMGNICQWTNANWPNIASTLDYNGLARRIHESIKKMNNEYVRQIHAGGGHFNSFRKACEAVGKNAYLRGFGFSSWCNFPFYEADFGWGKPIWVSTALGLNKLAIFLDKRDGKGIEAWVGLPKEHMAKFERNPGIIAYASFSPSI